MRGDKGSLQLNLQVCCSTGAADLLAVLVLEAASEALDGLGWGGIVSTAAQAPRASK
jgi:hypothetical protein